MQTGSDERKGWPRHWTHFALLLGAFFLASASIIAVLWLPFPCKTGSVLGLVVFLIVFPIPSFLLSRGAKSSVTGILLRALAGTGLLFAMIVAAWVVWCALSPEAA